MRQPPLTVQAEALEVAYQHLGWCVANRFSLPEIAASIGYCPGRKRYTVKELAAALASEWRWLKADPELRRAA